MSERRASHAAAGLTRWLNPRSLRWKFLLAPILGVLMIGVLAVFLFQLTWGQIRQLEHLQGEGFARAQVFTQLSNRLATAHARSYELLWSVHSDTDEGEFYDAAKPLLHEIHRIDDRLDKQRQTAGLTPTERERIAQIGEQLREYRVNITNAMLMATVVPTRSRELLSGSTTRFNQLNANLQALQQAIYSRLDDQLRQHEDEAGRRFQLFAALFVVAIATMLALVVVLSEVLSRDLRILVARLRGIVAAPETTAPGIPDRNNEVDTLSEAIERVRENYTALDQTRADLKLANEKLEESLETIVERESALADLNARLRRTVAEQQETIAAQKRAEEDRDKALVAARQANLAKSDFVANMSHELRTPLNAIIGFSGLMQAAAFGPIEHKYQEYAEDINLAANHLLGLVSDVLDIARIEAGHLDLDVAEVTVDDAFRTCAAMMRARAETAGIDLVFRTPPELPALYADPFRLNQILLNLVDNAIKFTPKGGTVEIAAAATNDDVTLTVTDTGVGIAEDDIPIALEKFGQVRHGSMVSHGGVGIGLALVRSLIELLDGEFRIESTLGKGTAVAATFPAHGPSRPPSRGVASC